MLKAGCQTPWSRVNVEGVPVCDNSSLLEKYSNTYWKAVDMDRYKLLEYTKCLMPCTFMEYKVTTSTQASLSLFLHCISTLKIVGGRPHKNTNKWLDIAVAHVCQ